METTSPTPKPAFLTKIAPIILTSVCFGITLILALIFYFAPITIGRDIINPFVFSIEATADFVNDVVSYIENQNTYPIEMLGIAILCVIAFVKMTIALVSTIAGFSSSFSKDTEKREKARDKCFAGFKSTIFTMIIFYIGCLTFTYTEVSAGPTTVLVFALIVFIVYDLYKYAMSNNKLKIHCYITRVIYHVTILVLTILFGLFLLNKPVFRIFLRNQFLLDNVFESDPELIFSLLGLNTIVPLFTFIIFSNYCNFIGLFFKTKTDIKENKDIQSKFTTLMVLSIILTALIFTFHMAYYTLLGSIPDDIVEIIIESISPTALPLLLISIAFKITKKIPTPTIDAPIDTDDGSSEETGDTSLDTTEATSEVVSNPTEDATLDEDTTEVIEDTIAEDTIDEIISANSIIPPID